MKRTEGETSYQGCNRGVVKRCWLKITRYGMVLGLFALSALLSVGAQTLDCTLGQGDNLLGCWEHLMTNWQAKAVHTTVVPTGSISNPLGKVLMWGNEGIDPLGNGDYIMPTFGTQIIRHAEVTLTQRAASPRYSLRYRERPVFLIKKSSVPDTAFWGMEGYWSPAGDMRPIPSVHLSTTGLILLQASIKEHPGANGQVFTIPLPACLLHR